MTSNQIVLVGFTLTIASMLMTIAVGVYLMRHVEETPRDYQPTFPSKRQGMKSIIEPLGTMFAAAKGAVLGSSGYTPLELKTPPVWDRFNGDGNVSWTYLPANNDVRVSPVVRDGALTADDSGNHTTAAYASIDFGGIPTSIRASISFSEGRSGGGAAIILTRTMNTASIITHIVDDGSVHVVFSDRKVSVGLFKGRDFFVAKTSYYPFPMTRDGTEYLVGYDIKGDTLTIFAPGIDGVEVTNPRVAELSGPYVTIEPYWESGQSQARFHLFQAR